MILFLIGCASIPSIEAAGVSYPTTPIAWPEAPECLNEETPGMAKEVLMGATRTIVVAGGDNPISDVDWADFSPGFGNAKNQDRNLLFEESCFSRSPAAPASCEGDACRSEVEIKGYTWIELSQVLAIDCIPEGTADCGTQGVPEGALTVTVTRKCHEIVFEGDAWILSGPSGERAIMHATEAAEPTGDVSLPDGWTLEQTTLAEPFVLHPFGAEGDCYYNILRDHRVQAYHQFEFAGPSFP
jgi:hypothetical protein